MFAKKIGGRGAREARESVFAKKEARESVFAKKEARGSVYAKNRQARDSASERKRAAYLVAAKRVVDAADHVDRALEQWSREMPEIEIKGADVLNRARRVVLESRGPIEENFRYHGLDSGEFDVLASLRRAGEPYGLRPTELFTSLMISSGGLTARLDRLEKAGFIRRRASAEDGRSLLVTLTAAGRKKVEAAFRADMDLENEMVSGLSDDERGELVRLLRKLTQAMKG